MKWMTSFANDEAATEVAFLFQNEDVKAEILRILALLADEPDPRSPRTGTGLLLAEVGSIPLTGFESKSRVMVSVSCFACLFLLKMNCESLNRQRRFLIV